MHIYTNVCGEEIKDYPDTRIILYERRDLEEMLMDSITQDWIKSLR